MRSTQLKSIIIACPHCGTRYQVPPETLGDAGRKVACAHCGEAWLAEPGATLSPMDDRLFSEADEVELDRGFAAEEAALRDVPVPVRQLIPKGEAPTPEVLRTIAEITAALEAAKTSQPAPATAAKPERPATKVAVRLPATRIQSLLRGVGVGLLVGVIAGAGLFRTEIVRLVPQLASVYAAVGLKTNVVGLEFSDVTTLMSRRGDADVISVNATIIGVEPRRMTVPPVVVTLLNEDNAPLYSWSASPKVTDLEPGEVVGFSTELAFPPKAARHLRLSFADGRATAPVQADIQANTQLEGPH